MYSVLVVDDEEIICKSLKIKIERIKKLNINEVYIAQNAFDALKIVEEKMPDVILTDIKMPEMDGIELIKEIYKRSLNIQFIVISGYDDYGYVRQAFQYGIVDYLLKPISSQDLEDKLQLAFSKIENEQMFSKGNVQDIGYILSLLLDTNTNLLNREDNNLKEFKRNMETNFPYKYFRLALIYYGDKHCEIENKQLLKRQIHRTINSRNEKEDIIAIEIYDKDENINILFNYDDYDVIQFLNRTIRRLEPFIKNSIIISISDTCESVDNLDNIYQQVTEALEYRILYPMPSVIEYGLCIREAEFMLTLEEIKKVFNGGDLDNLDSMYKISDIWFNKFNLKNQSMQNIHKLYNMILDRICVIRHNHTDMDRYTNRKNLNSFNKLEDIRSYLKKMIYDTIQVLNKEDKKYRTVVDTAKIYIERNHLKDVNLASVSNFVSMNYTYFSEVFKTEVGVNFSDYLMKVKMLRAKRLLQDSSKPIKDISYEVGYEDPKHFSRAFKNYYGITPSDFREKEAWKFKNP